MKRLIGIYVALMMLFTTVVGSGTLNSYALDVSDEATVTSVKFIKRHEEYDVAGGNVIIIGTNLDTVDVLFAVQGGVPQVLGSKHPDSTASFLNYVLTQQEVDAFNGKLYIGNKTVDLDIANFPIITGADNAVVNQDLGERLKLNGSNLNAIGSAAISASYGRGIQQRDIAISTPIDLQPNYVDFTPTAPGVFGRQDITLNQVNSGDPLVEVTYFYHNAFRILRSLDLAPVDVYPNAAAKGEQVTLTSDAFSDAKNYAVYFLSVSDNDYALDAHKKSPEVLLSADKKRMTVTVPNSSAFKLGTKRIVVVETVNDEIVARFNVPDAFDLIDAVNQPSLKLVNPSSGTDEGSKVQLIGNNILIPIIPELIKTAGEITVQTATPGDAGRTMLVDYDEANLTFKGVAVTTLRRSIRTTIGKRANYELLADGSVKYNKIGADDYLYISTDRIDDAADDPQRDVLIEIDTTIVDANGKVYHFYQSALKVDGFTFEVSSIKPNIVNVIPPKVQLDNNYRVLGDTLLTIEGDHFLVDKYADNNGNSHVHYPVVLVQVGGTLGDSNYIVKIDKNDTTGTAQGTVYDSNGVVADTPVDLVVLNDAGEVVDGSNGNIFGTKIGVYLPHNILIGSGGKKNIQVINPKRSSEDLGAGSVAIDSIVFSTSTFVPIIESVNPNVVVSDAQEEIVVTGSNFQEGIKLYIGGIEISDVVRQVSPQGDSITLTFKAPKGRVGQTQLQVVNPAGGTALYDFYYVRSLDQDPTIEAISPNRGTSDTLAIITGNNFVKSDVSVDTATGLDAYRLIGSRVLLDGVDVNQYHSDSMGKIKFEPYTAPTNNYQLYTIKNDKFVLSPFADNITLTDQNQNNYSFSLNSAGELQFYDDEAIKYTFVHASGQPDRAFDANGNLLGNYSLTDTALVVQGGPSFNIKLDNALLRATYAHDGQLKADLADYWSSVILQDSNTNAYYSLQKTADGTLKLSDGKQKSYIVKLTGNALDNPQFKAYDSFGNGHAITVNATGINVATAPALNLKMLTPYAVNGPDKRIIGNRVRVINKGQIRINVPNLLSGGPKTVTVLNPDTKKAELVDGFNYYKLPATKPIISSLIPNIGALRGGYIVTLRGRDFNESSQVYFDGVVVPPADKSVNLDGTALTLKVPAYPVDIDKVYGVNQLTVPVVVVNSDGGTATLDDGFTYVKASSSPQIDKLILDNGSAVGGEIVEIIGQDFRFFEPYENLGGSINYEAGIDTYNNLNRRLNVTPKWDDLLAKRYDGTVDLWEKTPIEGDNGFSGFDYYYASPILPRVYFGDKQAKVVDFANGYIKVITPPHSAGEVAVVVMNNDAGVSNGSTYTYRKSDLKITNITPPSGARSGGERRDIRGDNFMKSIVKAYQADDATQIVDATDKVSALVQFGNVGNRTIEIGQPNDGRINANRATVALPGGLKVAYNGVAKTLAVSLQERGKTYRRDFTNFTTDEVFVPIGMLKNGADYYQPDDYGYTPTDQYNGDNDYEWLKIAIDRDQKRLFVQRGFAPRVTLQNANYITLLTPSYYTIETVDVFVYNPDGSFDSTPFTYKNPASSPIIESVEPFRVSLKNTVENETDEDQRLVESSVSGGALIEIIGRDLRDGARVYLADKEAKVEGFRDDADNDRQVITIRIPAGKLEQSGQKLPIIVENSDGAIANSADPLQLGTDKRRIYFVYRKPLSAPTITAVEPQETSQYGGNTITISGSDFRSGATVLIGGAGGISIQPADIDSQGKYIKIKVPQGLKHGAKDIQVNNADFGMDIQQKALTIISYPTLEKGIYDKDGNRVERILITGGETIILKGENFTADATVIFGGQRQLAKPEETGQVGFFKDDKRYIVKDGITAQQTVVVDDKTLQVTTPAVTAEGEYAITVINGDSGISASGPLVKYGLPIPAAPASLKAAIVDNRYIKLYDYAIADSKYYEIYAYTGKKSLSALRKDNYRDFATLGTTARVPHKITRLASGVKLKKGDKARFMVKAVNKYGLSGFSNVATLKYNDIAKFLTTAKKEQKNSLLKQSGTVDIKRQPGKALVTLSDYSALSGQSYRLDDDQQALQQITVIAPDRLIARNKGAVKLEGELVDVNFSLQALNNRQFVANNTASNEYVTFKADWQQNAATAHALAKLPRAIKAVSPVVALSAEIGNNTGRRQLGQLNDGMALNFNLNSVRINDRQGPYIAYYFDSASDSWLPLANRQADGHVAINVSDMGYYILAKPY